MDDNFGTPLNNSAPEGEPAENASAQDAEHTVSDAASDSTDKAFNETPTAGATEEEPPTAQAQYAGNYSYTRAPYGGAPYGTSPYGAADKAPYDADRPYSQQSPSRPSPKVKKNSGKLGRNIFAVLMALCVIIASVSIGYSLRSGSTSSGNNTNVTGYNSENDNNSKTQSNDKTADENAPELTISSTPTSISSSGEKLSAEDVYQKVKSINVGVLIYYNKSLSNEGSGVLVGEDSTGTYTYVLTCAHVISTSGIEARIQFEDGSDIEAEIVGYDTKTDIGVLKIKKTGLSTAELGDVTALSVGQTVYAIGNPGGTEFFGSFTSGMISALDRPLNSSVGYELPCIQHNAAINPGNSGGALVNEYGQVIGINSSKIADTEYEGMGFAVPINTAKQVFDEIVKYGYVTNRPKLGITYSNISVSQVYSIIVQSNGLPSGSVIIRSIDSQSDLNGKDIQINDLIIAVDGVKLTETSILLEKIEKSNVGDSIKLTICRINNDYTVGSPFDVTVKLIEDKGSSASDEVTTTQNYFNPFGY